MLSDNGPNLLSGAVRHFAGLLKARHRTTTPYNPRTNGKVENFNGLIGRTLTKYLMGEPTRVWDEFLTKAAQFISIFECKKEGAREEWYSDFAKRAQTEDVGHPVDWLRTLYTRISVQYMVFEMEDL